MTSSFLFMAIFVLATFRTAEAKRFGSTDAILDMKVSLNLLQTGQNEFAYANSTGLRKRVCTPDPENEECCTVGILADGDCAEVRVNTDFTKQGLFGLTLSDDRRVVDILNLVGLLTVDYGFFVGTGGASALIKDSRNWGTLMSLALHALYFASGKNPDLLPGVATEQKWIALATRELTARFEFRLHYLNQHKDQDASGKIRHATEGILSDLKNGKIPPPAFSFSRPHAVTPTIDNPLQGPKVEEELRLDRIGAYADIAGTIARDIIKFMLPSSPWKDKFKDDVDFMQSARVCCHIR